MTFLTLSGSGQPPTGNGILTEKSGISGLISRADVAALVSDLISL